jgi:ABC-type phosphate/phosphonate transport system substrate-binding protein
VQSVADLKGKTVAVGAADSPQATLIPLAHLKEAGLTPGEDFQVQRHDLLTGKHGDHIGGERDAARTLIAGQADAACMIEGNYNLFQDEGTLPPGATRVLTRTTSYDHCNFTVTSTTPPALIQRFQDLLLSMSYDDPEVRPLFDMEGLTAWREGRVEGYQALETAVDEFGYYDQQGAIPS